MGSAACDAATRYCLEVVHRPSRYISSPPLHILPLRYISSPSATYHPPPLHILPLPLLSRGSPPRAEPKPKPKPKPNPNQVVHRAPRAAHSARTTGAAAVAAAAPPHPSATPSPPAAAGGATAAAPGAAATAAATGGAGGYVAGGAPAPPLRILDPFCGEGSVLAAANALGVLAVGVDSSRKRCRHAAAYVRERAEPAAGMAGMG